jgi:hypothetical protein
MQGASTTRYFTGEPCKNGHVAERMISNKDCVLCLKEQHKIWKKNNPDKVREQDKRSRNKPERKEKRAITSAQWYKLNKDKSDTYAKEWRKNTRLFLMEQFGGKCKDCGADDLIVLDFDHIDDDGFKDSGKNIIFEVKQNPSRFQLLCKNCNWRKEYYRRQRDAFKISEASKNDGCGSSLSQICS